MASTQVVCAAEYGACVIRATRLNSSCVPQSGANNGALASCIADLTATPVVAQATEVTWPGGSCDDDECLLTIRKPEKIQRWDLTLQLKFWDYELLEIMTSNPLMMGKAAGPYAGHAVGMSSVGVGDGYTINGAMFEVYTRNVTESSLCVASGSARYKHWVFPKTTWRLGDQPFNNDNPHVINLVGTAETNPAWTDVYGDWEGNSAVIGHWSTAWTDALPLYDSCGYVLVS
jgi:hypothetical protein